MSETPGQQAGMWGRQQWGTCAEVSGAWDPGPVGRRLRRDSWGRLYLVAPSLLSPELCISGSLGLPGIQQEVFIGQWPEG